MGWTTERASRGASSDDRWALCADEPCRSDALFYANDGLLYDRTEDGEMLRTEPKRDARSERGRFEQLAGLVAPPAC